MSESLRHRKLVEHLREHIHTRYGNVRGVAVYADLDNGPDSPPPPNIKGNIPDVFATVLATGAEIIGEAKTAKDFETPRSIAQIENFLDFVQKRRNRIFFLCVPWHIEIYAEGIVNDMASKKGIKSDQAEIVVLI